MKKVWDVASEKPRDKSARNVRGSRVRAGRRFRKFFATLGIFALVLVGLCYVFRKPIQREMRAQLEAELTRNGIHATYVTSDFNLLRGLILSDVELFETEKKEIPKLALSRVAVRYDIIGLLLRSTSSAVNLDLDRSDLSIWEDAERYDIRDLTASIRAGRSGMELEDFSLNYGDLDLNLDADVEWQNLEDERKRRKERRKNEKKEDEDGEEKKDEKKDRKKGVDVSEIVKVLKQIPDTGDGDIRISIRYDFRGDALVPKVDGVISANKITWEGVTLENIFFNLDSATSADGNVVIGITEGRFTTGGGAMSMAGTFDPEGKTIRLDRFQSDIDPVPLITAIEAQKPEEKQNPIPEIPKHRVRAKGVFNLEKPLKSEITGDLETFSELKIPFEGNKEQPPIVVNRVKSGFAISSDSLEFRQLDAEIATGKTPTEIGGGGFRLIYGENDKPVAIELNGLLIERNGGSLAAVGKIDLEQKVVSLEKLDSNLDFVPLLVDLGLDDPFQGGVTFEKPPVVTLSGSFPLEYALDGEIQASVKLEGTTTIGQEENGAASPLKFRDVLAGSVSISENKLNIQQLNTTVGREGEPETKINATLVLDFEKNVPEAPKKNPVAEMTRLRFGPVTAMRDGGELFLEGEFLPETQRLTLGRLESQLDLMAVLASFNVPDVLSGKLRFPTPPTINLIGEIPFKNPAEIVLKGSVTADAGLVIPLDDEGKSAFTVDQVDIPELVFRDQKLSIPNIAATAGMGETPLNLLAVIEADFGQEKSLTLNEVRISREERNLHLNATMPLPPTEIEVSKLESNIDILAALRDFGIGDPTNGMVVFNEPPLISGDGKFDLKNMGASEATGTIQIPAGFSVNLEDGKKVIVREFDIGRFQFADRGIVTYDTTASLGAAANPVALTVDLGLQFYPETSPAIGFKKVVARQAGKSLDFAGTYLSQSKELVVTSFNSALDPLKLLADIGIGDPLNGVLSFNEAPKMAAAGTLNLENIYDKSDLKGSLQAPTGFRYQLEGENREVKIDSFETTFGIGSGSIQTPKLVAQSFGGKIEANTILRPQMEPFNFEAAIRLTDIQLEKVTGFFEAGEERTGRISAEFNGGGSATMSGIQGAGKIDVTEARLTNVPIYKGLRPLLLAINLGEWKAEDGNEIVGEFAVNSGVVTSRDMRLIGDFYQVKSQLNIDFPNSKIKADGTVSTTGATRVVTEIVGKILEVEAEGNFEDIKWRLKNAPSISNLKDLTALPGDILKNTLTNAAQPGKLIQDAGSMVGNVGTAARDTLENTASGIGKTLKGLGGLGKKMKGESVDNDREEPAPVPEPTPENGGSQ